ncbi:MAG: PTS sugar transporter subunit IIA [Chlamydiales bacterium]
MDLGIKDVAELLNVSENSIYKWIKDGKMPAYLINKQYRFSRNEVENAVFLHHLGNDQDILEKFEDSEVLHSVGVKQYGLYRAIHKGLVLNEIKGESKEEIISNTMQSVAEDLDLDAFVLTELLLDRENLMPTALGNGIAVPHTRDFLLDKHYDAVTVVFLDKPIEYGALDRNPVHTLFFLFACDDKRHLNLLAKIAHLASKEDNVRFLKTKPSKQELLEYIKGWEGSSL